MPDIGLSNWAYTSPQESSEEHWEGVDTVMTSLLQMRTGGTGRFRDLPKVLQLLNGGTGIPGQVGKLHNLVSGNTDEGHLSHVFTRDSPRHTAGGHRQIVNHDSPGKHN